MKKGDELRVFPGSLAAVLVMVISLSLSYLWLCSCCESAGRRIKGLESVYSEVRQRRFNEEYKWHNVKSQENIERALAQHGLQMTWPEKRRAVHVSVAACQFDEETEYRMTQNDHESSLRMAMR